MTISRHVVRANLLALATAHILLCIQIHSTIAGHANTNNFSFYDRIAPRCTRIPDGFELIATARGSGPFSRVHNDLALPLVSNSSPTAVAFAKARIGPSRHCNTNVIGIVNMRTSSANDAPRQWTPASSGNTGAIRLALDSFR
jgi:hypothetical protein